MYLVYDMHVNTKITCSKNTYCKNSNTIISIKFKQVLFFTIYFNAYFFTLEQGRINSHLTGVQISLEGVVALVRLRTGLRSYSATIVGFDLVISYTKL